MNDFKYATRFPGEDEMTLKVAAKEAGLSLNQLIVRCVHERLPAIRAEARAQTGRVTNVDPLPPKQLVRLYQEREEDAEMISKFIAAQPKAPE